jgi:hypothetical protein|tara:strand:+ start:65 stop:586 length:522 start_codon:yes stop_codon:yes gene_type:complete
MKLFVTIIIIFILSGCMANKNKELTADINMAVLTAKSEEDFRNTEEISYVRTNGVSQEYIIEEPAKKVWNRVLTCYGKDRGDNIGGLVENATAISIYEYTLVAIANSPWSTMIGSIIEMDIINSNKVKITFVIHPSNKNKLTGTSFMKTWGPWVEKNVRNDNCPAPIELTGMG